MVLSATPLLAQETEEAPAAAADSVYSGHGASMFGDLKYGPDFAHFDYVNPDAPKGGEARLAATGTFDNLNPFILKGVSAAGSTLPFDTLTTQSLDEPFSEYGLLAESIEIPEDRSWVAFTLRPEARWHDGTPVTADDVVFTFQTLTTEGHPFYRAYYANVDKVEVVGERKVRFTFKGDVNRELPLIIGQMPVFQKAYFTEHPFAETTLDAPMGSGPYRVESVDPGRSITYRRDPDYWGKDLPVNRGQNNVDLIRFDYYRDATVAIEALKAHEYDFRAENISKEWATAYDVPAVRKGLLLKEMIDNQLPTGMQGFVYNTRREKFSDPRVRHALAYAFDFEWTNQNLFYGQYTRTESYFSNSELASSGLPEGDELALLEPYRDQLPEEVFTTEYHPPSTDGSGNIRDNLRVAAGLLQDAGWEVRDGVLTNTETGQPMVIEFLLVSPAFERIVSPFIRNLERLGVEASIRTVDSSQYQNRLDNFDFDMTVKVWGESLSPGNEQRDFWTSEAAETPGSDNLAGIKNPVVDALVAKVIHAESREALVTATHALDRVLLWGHYVIPHWHIQSFRLIYWDKFGRPENMPPYGLAFPTIWWVDQQKDQAVAQSADAVVAEAGTGDEEPSAETQPAETEPAATDDTASAPAAPDTPAADTAETPAEEGTNYLVIAVVVVAVLILALLLARRRGGKS